jgi:mRNA interferase RelE/StbE
VSYQVVLRPVALQQLAAIKDHRERDLIAKRIDELAQNPLHLGKPLTKKLRGYRSVRAVGQRYRIIYRVDDNRVLVIVVALGLRREGSPDDIYTRTQQLEGSGQLEPDPNG